MIIGLSRFQIKKEFVKKSLPQAPPKKILRMKNQTLLEEVDINSLNSLRLVTAKLFSKCLVYCRGGVL